jgi:hypothetical protein
MEKAVEFMRDILGALYGAAGIIIAILIVAWLVDTPAKNDEAKSAQPKQEAVSIPSPATERGFQVMEVATVQLRRCIRSSVEPAYASGVYGRSQFVAFVKSRCYPPFNASFVTSGLGDVELLNATYDVILEQEIASLKN